MNSAARIRCRPARIRHYLLLSPVLAWMASVSVPLMLIWVPGITYGCPWAGR